MDDLRELYQTTILDHNRSPRNFRELPDANRRARGHNPLCGDQLTVTVRVDEEDRVVDIGFVGSGCAISKASASLMTEFAKGKSRKEIEETFQRFLDVVTGRTDAAEAAAGLGKLAVFAGVREYPMRVKCATLAWHALESALENRGEVARTE
jgi:nitrogen fixation NifU-like protein